MKRKYDSSSSSKDSPIKYNYTTNISPFDKQNFTNKNFPNIQKPKIIGHFSINDKRKFVADSSMLKYLNIPKNYQKDFNLNLGYENVVHKPESSPQNEKINHILQFILNNQKIDDNKLFPVDFVCFRGLLRLLMCSPYEYNEDWIILATKYKGRIYLCQKQTEKKKLSVLNESEMQKRICSYGFKFEQFILSDEPCKLLENHLDPVNESEEFCCMYNTKLGNMRLLYGAEMDGIISDSIVDIEKMDPNELEFVEVKVKLKENNFNQRRNYFKFKLRNWWCQCFLVDVQKIFVGERNDDGIVNNISEIKTNSIPKLSAEYWSPTVCVSFLENILMMISKILKEINCSKTVYEFYWNPRDSKNVCYNIHSGENNLSFLPEWFLKNNENI